MASYCCAIEEKMWRTEGSAKGWWDAADQKQDGTRQSARSSASTYIRMRVHGQMYLFRFVSRCILPSRCWAHRTMHEHTHTRGSESSLIRSVSTKSRCRGHVNFTPLKNRTTLKQHKTANVVIQVLWLALESEDRERALDPGTQKGQPGSPRIEEKSKLVLHTLVPGNVGAGSGPWIPA